MAEAEDISLSETKRLCKDLLTSVSHVNNAALLLSILSSNRAEKDVSSTVTTQCRLEALRSLHAFFIPLLRSGKILAAKSSKLKEQSEANDEHGEAARKNAEAVYHLWVWNKYRDFKRSLFRAVAHQGNDQLLKVTCITTLMDLVREEQPGRFNNALYLKICDRMVAYRGQSDQILRVLTAKYFKYSDVRYFTHFNLEKLITRRLGSKHLGQETISSDEDTHEDRDGISSHTYVRNVYNLLSHLPPPKVNSKDVDVVDELWVNSSGEGGSVEMETGKKNVDQHSSLEEHMRAVDASQESKSWKRIKRHKYLFSKAWLSFLQLPIPLDIYKKILAMLHRNVIPHMTNPILLSDFLTRSYDTGGLISVMALSSLFILITKFGLEYPEFYNKLYALLEPSIFVAKYRSRFFELLDTCLSSSHLPGYMGAAFAKRLGRLALAAPPSGGIVVIALVHNLLRRHPSINVLVHQPVSTNVLPSSEVASEDNGNVSNVEDSALKERQGADPFVATEPDTARCNASKSSLWELEALRRHYCPAVSRFVESLETDLTVRAKTTEMLIRDFSSASYATIFGEEVGRRLKSAPLAFYATLPDRLFPETDFDDAFAGWKFEENPSLEDRTAYDASLPPTKHRMEEVHRNDDLVKHVQSDDTSSDNTADSRSRSDESEDGGNWPGSRLKRLRSS